MTSKPNIYMKRNTIYDYFKMPLNIKELYKLSKAKDIIPKTKSYVLNNLMQYLDDDKIDNIRHKFNPIRSLSKDKCYCLEKQVSNNRSFIGIDQWNFLLGLLTLTENELYLIHCLFMMLQIKGSISPANFWKLIRYLHSTSGEPTNMFEFLASNSYYEQSTGSNSSTQSIEVLVSDSEHIESNLIQYMNQECLLGKLTFKILDVYELGNLTFFEFALVQIYFIFNYIYSHCLYFVIKLKKLNCSG